MSRKKIAPNDPPAAPTVADGGLWTDAALATELGVAVELVAELRGLHCIEEGDLVDRRGVIIFTEVGREKIRTALEAQMLAAAAEEPGEKPAKKKPEAPAGLPKEDLRVSRIFRGSPRILALRPNGNEVVLIVKDSALLEPGMLLPDCEQGDYCWYYLGRLPRISGEKQLYFPERASATPA